MANTVIPIQNSVMTICNLIQAYCYADSGDDKTYDHECVEDLDKAFHGRLGLSGKEAIHDPVCGV